MRKIVHIIFSLNIGGSESLLVDIINEQSKTEKVFLVIINNVADEKVLSCINPNVKTYCLGRKEKSKNPFYALYLNVALAKLNCDVIHCHSGSVIKMILLRNKCVVTLHDVHNPTKYLKKYKKIFAISKAVQKYIEVRENLKSILIYNGIRTSDIIKKEYKNAEGFRIVQIGRFDHMIKGQHILIRAITILIREYGYNNCFLDFIGDGPSFDFLRSLVSKNKLENYVNFLGAKSRDYIYKNLANYDLLVQPSLSEGLGLTILEAMSARVPVLSSNLDGPMELIEFDRFGSSFTVGNDAECAYMISKIIGNYQTYLQKADKALINCSQNYSIGSTVLKYLDNY